jgi:hypothetical protein
MPGRRWGAPLSEGIGRLSGGLVAAWLLSSRGSVMLPRLSTCGKQSARIPEAAAPRAADWHNSSVSKFIIRVCGSAGLPVRESSTRIYPEACILVEKLGSPVSTFGGLRSS